MLRPRSQARKGWGRDSLKYTLIFIELENQPGQRVGFMGSQTRGDPRVTWSYRNRPERTPRGAGTDSGRGPPPFIRGVFGRANVVIGAIVRRDSDSSAVCGRVSCISWPVDEFTSPTARIRPFNQFRSHLDIAATGDAAQYRPRIAFRWRALNYRLNRNLMRNDIP